MVKVAKKTKSKSRKDVNDISSDESSYDEFDPKDPFKDDEIEKFHSNSDKMLLNTMKAKNKKGFNYSSDEEEVLAFSGEDDSDDEDDDDREYEENVEDDEDEDEENEVGGEDGDDGLINKSWGSRKSAYYAGNDIDDEENAELEEEEAKLMQEKMMKQLDISDFDLDIFKTSKDKTDKNNKQIDLEDDDNNNLEKITKNLTLMNKNEKLDFLKQESPELFELVNEFTDKINELQETLIPIYNAINNGKIEHSSATDYILNKMKLYLMYCSHLSFYFLLKSQRSPVDNHPIIKNILQFRHLCKQINPIDENLNEEIKFLIEKLQSGQKITIMKGINNKLNNKKKKKLNVKFKLNEKRKKIEFDDDDDDVQDDNELEDIDHEMEQDNEIDHENDRGNDMANNKRAINYQIEKNKGLTPKRNKLARNPRVKHKEKYRKALIKRKSIVPKVRNEDKRYSGEATGIRIGVVRGRKLK